MIKEIELKLYIGPSEGEVMKKLKDLQCEFIGKKSQVDTYYTSKHKDFIKNEECLRIRRTDNQSEITWKPPTTGEMLKKKQFWKQEIDLVVSGQESTAKELLEMLDFIEYVTVDKVRYTYKVSDETSIALDHINPLGWFLEIETMSDSDEKGIKMNSEIARLLGVNPESVVNVPYRDMVKAGRVYTH